ncbi:MAG: carboxypeptidase, partial [Leptospira sp.]
MKSKLEKIYLFLIHLIKASLLNFKKHYKRILKLGSILCLLLISFFIGGSYVSWTSEKPRVEKNLNKFATEINRVFDPSTTSPILIKDKNGILIGEFYRNNLKPIRVDNLDDHRIIVWALLSAEDREFYNHSGINYIAIFRAILVNLSRFRLSQGGSTITQQLAKLTLNLGERNLFNKLTEVYATYYIENRFSKQEILSMYLNQIYLGQDNTGVESASRYYFDKSASDLSPAEAAMIIGIIPAPSVYNPIENLRYALLKQSIVLKEMAKTHDSKIRPSNQLIGSKFDVLLDDSIRKFKKTYAVAELKTNDQIENSSNENRDEDKKKLIKIKYTSIIGSKGYDRNFKVNLAPDFNSDIRKYILDVYTDEELENKNIIVHTTLDYEKQKIAEVALKEGMQTIKNEILQLANPGKSKKKSKTNPPSQELVQEIASGMRGGFVSLNSKSGDVEVFINSVKISNSYRPNRLEYSYRQPGSTIKALVYALAFEKRIVTPSSIIKDEAISYNGYSPKNWYAGYKGDVTVRRAFAQSMNTVSVKLLKQVGVSYFIERIAQILDLDINTAKERFTPNLSLALGSGEITPMELSIIYATIQNGGKKVTPRKIRKITDSSSLEDFSNPEPDSYQIIDPIACAMALDTLQSVLTEEGTMPIRLSVEDRFPMGGKTGTVQSPKEARKKWSGIEGVRDTWFAGLVPEMATVVWIGNDWGAPFPGSGSGTTGKIWWKFSQAVASRSSTGRQLLSEEIKGSYMKLDICADDGTLLEPNYEKEFLDPISVSEVNPSVEQVPTETDKSKKITSTDKSGKKIKTLEAPKVNNFAYCKFPLLNQYYYIG